MISANSLPSILAYSSMTHPSRYIPLNPSEFSAPSNVILEPLGKSTLSSV